MEHQRVEPSNPPRNFQRAARRTTRRWTHPRSRRGALQIRSRSLAPDTDPEQQVAGLFPTILVVAGTRQGARTLRRTLARRFGADYRVAATYSVEEAMEALATMRGLGEEVALILAEFRLGEMTGLEFLEVAHASEPGARRGVLTTVGADGESRSIHRAMALGQLDLSIARPWDLPEESLYPQISDALATWWRDHRKGYERVKIIGHQWGHRSHQLRDLGTRNDVPYGFYPVDSKEGQRLIEQHGIDVSRLPVLILEDCRVLVDPTIAEIAEALGVSTQTPAEPVDVGWSSRAGCGCLRRVRRLEHGGDRAGGVGRSSRHKLDDQELPWLSRRNKWKRSRTAGAPAGAPLWRPLCAYPGGHRVTYGGLHAGGDAR